MLPHIRVLQSADVTLHIRRSACAASSLFKKDEQQSDTWLSSKHKWMWMTLVRTWFVDWSHSRWQLQKKLACKSLQWVKCKQSWDFRTCRIYKFEALRHLGALPTVPAMYVGDVCRRSGDFLNFFDMSQYDQCDWTNIVHCHHCPLPSPSRSFLFCHTSVGWDSSWIFTIVGNSHAALWNVMISTQFIYFISWIKV